MPDYPIVDSHVHLCDPGALGYGWAKGHPKLDRRILPGDLTKAAAPVEVERFVFVEVNVDPPQHLDEAAWVARQAEADPRLAGMVACLPLERGKAVERDLDQLRQHKLLRSVRRLIQTQPHPDFCVQPSFIEGLRLLAPHDIAFDICIYHHHLSNTIKMVHQCPDVRFVLNHIGKPAIKEGAFDPWRQHLKELAALPNVHCKISGVVTEADHGNWTREQIRPYVEHTIESFGFDRVMYGGDWHVLELASTYPEWVAIVDWIVEDCTAEEKRKLFRDNAISFYRL